MPYPMTAKTLAEFEQCVVEPIITCDPRRQFGRPCVEGTRIPADAVAGCVFGGDSVDEVADDYGIARIQVLWCCAWWVQEGHLKPYRGERRKLWAAWTEHAFRVLGGWDKGSVLCDPDDFDAASGSTAEAS